MKKTLQLTQPTVPFVKTHITNRLRSLSGRSSRNGACISLRLTSESPRASESDLCEPDVLRVHTSVSDRL